MDSIIHITQHMTPNQRVELSRVLSSLDTAGGGTHSESSPPNDSNDSNDSL
jgi:hypothetical protein